jgi:hypothetical protein
MAAHTSRYSTLQDLKVVHRQIVDAHNRSPHSTLGSKLTPTEVFLGKYSNAEDSAKFATAEEEAAYIRDTALQGHRKLLKQMQAKVDNHNDSVVDTFEKGDVVAVLDPKCVDTKKKNVPLSLCAVGEIVRGDDEKFNHYFLRWKLTSTKRRDVKNGKVSTTSWNGKFLLRIPSDVNVNQLIIKILDENMYEVRHIFCSSWASKTLEYLVCFAHDSVPLSRFVHHSEVDHLVKNYPDIPDATALEKEACLVICRMFGALGVGHTAEALKRAIQSRAVGGGGALNPLDSDATEEEDVETESESEAEDSETDFDVDTFPPAATRLSAEGERSTYVNITDTLPQHTPPKENCGKGKRRGSTAPAKGKGKGKGRGKGKGASQSAQTGTHSMGKGKGKGMLVSSQNTRESLWRGACELLHKYTGAELSPHRVDEGNSFYYACFVLVKAYNLESKLMTKGLPTHACDLKKSLLEYGSFILQSNTQVVFSLTLSSLLKLGSVTSTGRNSPRPCWGNGLTERCSGTHTRRCVSR